MSTNCPSKRGKTEGAAAWKADTRIDGLLSEQPPWWGKPTVNRSQPEQRPASAVGTNFRRG